MDRLPPERLRYLIQFCHPDKILAGLSGAGDAMAALALGIERDELRSIKAELQGKARGAATELLADPEFAERIDRLPFHSGDKIVGLGDSITDDYRSWLEILRHALDLRRPGHGIALINAGLSGDTTAQLVARFLTVAVEKPELIICMAGTNDARRHGLLPINSLVSPGETARNLELLRNFAATQTAANWVWMTPVRVIEEKILSHWFLSELQISFRNDDLDVVADIVRARAEPVIDLHALFRDNSNSDWLLDDGLHPSLTGQKAITRAVVEHFSP